MPPLFSRLCKQAPLLRTVILAVLLPVTVVYLFLAAQPFVPFDVLLRDTNAEVYDPQGNVMFYRGALSNIGILLWWTSTCICAFAAFLFGTFKKPTWIGKAFLSYLAVFTELLALDDLFMLHEEVFPVRLGVSELVLYAVYSVLAAGLVSFLPLLLELDFALLGLALGFFALSVASDKGVLRLLFDLRGPTGLLFEDLAKMLGIVCWLIFSLRSAVQLLRTETADVPLYKSAETVQTSSDNPRQPKSQL